MIDALLTALSAKKAFSAVVPLGVSAIVALSFTADDVSDVLTTVGTVAGIIFAGYQMILISRINLIKAQIEAARADVAETLAEAKVINGHVNSAASKAQAIIESQELQMAMQRETIAAQKEQAGLLAQAAAIATAHAPTAPPAVPATEHLEEIEVNTKDTADTLKGTARALKTTAKALKGKK